MNKQILGSVAFWTLSTLTAWAGPVEEMIATDRAFAAMAMEDGIANAFVAYASDDVRMFPDGGQPYSGKQTLAERFATIPAGATLEWEPVEGVAGPSGEFGFTWGRSIYTGAASSDGVRPEAHHGKYISIWQRDADGNWKFVADIGNTNPDPDAAP